MDIVVSIPDQAAEQVLPQLAQLVQAAGGTIQPADNGASAAGPGPAAPPPAGAPMMAPDASMMPPGGPPPGGAPLGPPSIPPDQLGGPGMAVPLDAKKGARGRRK